MWLYGVARQLLANARRAEHRAAGLLERVGRDGRARGADRHGDHSDLTVEQIVVAEALARLSEADRELICLIAWDGLTPAQAAEVLGCRASALTTRLHRARARLRKLIDSTSPKG